MTCPVGNPVVGAHDTGDAVVGAHDTGDAVVGAPVGAMVVGPSVLCATVTPLSELDGAAVLGADVTGAAVVGARVVGAHVVGAAVVGACDTGGGAMMAGASVEDADSDVARVPRRVTDHDRRTARAPSLVSISITKLPMGLSSQHSTVM